MYAVVGTLFVALAVLGFTVLMLASRKPSPPAWTSYTLTHEIVAIGTVSLGGVGIALVIQSIGLFIQQPPTALHVILVASILLVFVVVWRRLRVRATLAEYARQTKGATPSEPASRPALVPDVAGPSPVTNTPEDPSTPTRPRTPRLPKKAA